MKKLLCKIFGHKSDNIRSNRFTDSDGIISTWTSRCTRCKCELFSAKGMVKNDPNYITTIKLKP